MAGFAPMGDFTVTYTDGRTESTVSNFLGLMEIERRWPGDDVPYITAITTAVWFYLGCPGGDLDAWAATVHEIDSEDEETAQVPTEPTAGAA